MKQTIDLKSLLIGALGALTLMFATGAGVPDLNNAPRFQIDVIPGRAFVLDTETGQVWEKFFPTGAGGITSLDFDKPKGKK